MGKWFNKTTLQFIERASPTTMRKNYGGVFTDGDGHAKSNADWEYSPDMSAVEGWESKYRKWSGDSVVLMDKTARDAIDVAEKAAQKTAEIDSYDNPLLRVLLSRVNALEANAGITPTTMDAAKAEAKLGT